MITDILQFISEIKVLFKMFGDAGFIHLLMEPLFTYGIGFSLLLFLVALAAGERRSRTLALLLLIVCSIFIYPYQQKRNEGAPRPNYHEFWTSDGGKSRKLWDQQTERRRHFQYIYYLLAVMALLNIVLPPDGIAGKVLSIFVVGTASMVLICSLWLNLHEKRIFHPDLRWEQRGPVTQATLAEPEREWL